MKFWKLILKEIGVLKKIGVLKINWKLGFQKLNLKETGILRIRILKNYLKLKIMKIRILENLLKLDLFLKLNLKIGVLKN